MRSDDPFDPRRRLAPRTGVLGYPPDPTRSDPRAVADLAATMIEGRASAAERAAAIRELNSIGELPSKGNRFA